MLHVSCIIVRKPIGDESEVVNVLILVNPLYANLNYGALTGGDEIRKPAEFDSAT